MKITHLYILFIMVLSACSQGQKPTPTNHLAEVTALHHQQRAFHFEKRAREFSELLSEDHISINRGTVSFPTRAENAARFQQYFDAVAFEKWDDLDPPIINFSDDSTMAYTVVHKEVVLTTQDSLGQQQKESVEYAWLAIYRRQADGWKIECVASTNKAAKIE